MPSLAPGPAFTNSISLKLMIELMDSNHIPHIDQAKNSPIVGYEISKSYASFIFLQN